jgi:hypothetical protein
LGRAPPRFDSNQETGGSIFCREKGGSSGRRWPVFEFEEFTKAQNLPGKDSPELREFSNLLQNPWFTRAWVFQEVVASELVDMRCGQYTITYPEFYRACLSVDYYGLRGDIKTMNDVTFAIHTGSLHEKRHVEKNLEFSGMSLLSLLMFRRNTQATDPRDKVFTFVGIANDGDHPALQADYSKDVNDVYVEVAMHLLTYTDPDLLIKGLIYSITRQRKEVYQRSSLDLLSLAYGLNEHSGLPSWVPDWRLPMRQFLPDRNTDGSRRFHATGSSRGVFAKRENHHRIIGVGGFQFDKIAALSCPGLKRDDDPRKPDFDSFWQIMGEDQEWGLMAKSIAVDGRYAYTGQDIELALLETKVVDLTPWGRRLDNDGKMTHWPGWMKSASPARDAAT